MEARVGIEPTIEILQTSALPLGYRAIETQDNHREPQVFQAFLQLFGNAAI